MLAAVTAQKTNMLPNIFTPQSTRSLNPSNPAKIGAIATLMRPSLSTFNRDSLDGLRRSLLRLHKVLVERERIAYERLHGRIASSGQVLQLVINDPQFAWLHGISELLVRMDEALESEELSAEEIDLLVLETRAMFKPVEAGNSFQIKYYDALQTDPEVVLAHGEVWKILRRFPAHAQANESA
jgi:hypothetical protein